MELNEIRPFFSLAFKRLLQLDPQETERIEQAEEEPEELEDPELKEDDFGYGAAWDSHNVSHKLEKTRILMMEVKKYPWCCNITC